MVASREIIVKKLVFLLHRLFTSYELSSVPLIRSEISVKRGHLGLGGVVLGSSQNGGQVGLDGRIGIVILSIAAATTSTIEGLATAGSSISCNELHVVAQSVGNAPGLAPFVEFATRVSRVGIAIKVGDILKHAEHGNRVIGLFQVHGFPRHGADIAGILVAGALGTVGIDEGLVVGSRGAGGGAPDGRVGRRIGIAALLDPIRLGSTETLALTPHRDRIELRRDRRAGRPVGARQFRISAAQL